MPWCFEELYCPPGTSWLYLLGRHYPIVLDQGQGGMAGSINVVQILMNQGKGLATFDQDPVHQIFRPATFLPPPFVGVQLFWPDVLADRRIL